MTREVWDSGLIGKASFAASKRPGAFQRRSFPAFQLRSAAPSPRKTASLPSRWCRMGIAIVTAQRLHRR